jgi:dTDP-4-dehydrorhamnose reductase
MPKLLITGASGFLGSHICQLAQNPSPQTQSWQVHGTYQTNAAAIPGVSMSAIDLTHKTALTTFLTDLKPDAIIHTAALSAPNDCQNNPELSYQVNVLATWSIAEYCATTQIPCVFTSSEQVFDGNRSPYHETDPTSPINLYGEHKVAAETGMLARYPQAAVCRMPLMYGISPTASSFIQPFIQRLRSGTSLQAFTDEIRTPVSGNDAALGLLIALEKHQGILHLGGRERLSRYQMAEALIDVLGIANATIEPCRQADVPMPAPRPLDLTMDSTIAYGLGFDPRDFRSVLAELKHKLV